MFAFVLLRIIAVILLVAANAFFVAAEFALVGIRETRVEQLIEARRIGARTLRKLHNKLDETLNGIQLGVTIASLALGWVGETAFGHLLEQPLQKLPHGTVYAHVVGVTMAFAVITYLHVILGEVVPKSISLQQAERVALAVAGPLDIFITVFSPFTRFMAQSAKPILRLFGSRELRESSVHSPEELKLIVTSSRRFGLIPPLQEELIHRALDLDSVTVREVMIPRPDIFSLPGDMPLEEAMVRVVEEQHSRIPVYDPARGAEAIVGVLYSKDLMRWMQFRMRRSEQSDQPVRRQTTLLVRHIMRDVMVVPETKPLPDLLEEFKRRRRHLAVVVDEFGSTAGVVSVEDVLEQLVGEIEDEFDVTARTSPGNSTTVVLDGSTNIRDLESQYRIRIPRDEGYETLAGFVLTRLQRIPRVGDSFLFNDRRYTILQMDGFRVEAVKVDLVPGVTQVSEA